MRGFRFLWDFAVTTHPDLDPELEEISGKTEAGKKWFLADLSVVDGYRERWLSSTRLPA